MAALSGLRERQETTRRTSRCSLERFGTVSHNNAATHNVAVLHVLLQRCKLRGYGTVSRVATTLRRCAWLQRCGGAARMATMLRRCNSYGSDAAALQLGWVRHCGAAASVAATLRRCS